MKAVQIDKFGGVEGVSVHADIPVPSLKANQVLVKIRAASFNPFDAIVRKGMMQKMIPLTLPVTAGADFTGRIETIGAGVTGLSAGDEVYGSAIVLGGGSGAFAEFAASNTDSIAKKPKLANFLEAAALPLVGCSAVQALEEHIQLKPNQKILIHGGAGGIGHIAIQLAKSIGAYVVTTVRTKDMEFVKKLGADEVVDFSKEDFSAKCKNFDAVFDTVGGETATKSFAVLKKNGLLVSMKGQPDEMLATKFGVRGIGQRTKTNNGNLNRLRELVDTVKLHIHIDKIFPLDAVQAAWRYQEEGHPQGKVVLQISNDVRI